MTTFISRLLIVFSLVSATATPAFVETPVNTATIAASAVAAAPKCLDYCVEGVCLSIICTPFGCKVKSTPWISHNIPELVVSAYSQPGEIPWTEAKNTYGIPARGTLAGNGPFYTSRAKSGHKKNANSRAHSNLHFKEASVIGSPTGVFTRYAISNSGFCPSKSRPFFPYFQSEYDYAEWRFGLAEKLYPASWLPGMREVSQTPLTTWGNIHPRTAFVKSEHPGKAGAVIAQRAVDIVTRSYQPHIYYPAPLPASNEKKDNWQMIHPEVEVDCKPFGGATDYEFYKTSLRDDFSWLYWQNVNCCPQAPGYVFNKISFSSPICITP